MARRWLPPRTTRGQKPVSTPAEQNHDDLLYNAMFGDNLDDEEDYVERINTKIQKRQKNKFVKSYLYRTLETTLIVEGIIISSLCTNFQDHRDNFHMLLINKMLLNQLFCKKMYRLDLQECVKS